MKIFQTFRKYDPYIPHFEKKYRIADKDLSFEEHKRLLIKDRFFATHILKPVLNIENSTLYTIWDYPSLQLKWAKEKGWNETNLKKILFAQIEDFNPDVFYTNSPISFEASEIKNIGSRNMIKCAWFASPEPVNFDLSVYHTRLTNFPLDIKDKSKVGFRSDYFNPSYDPEMDEFAESKDRPIDIFFYGQYVRNYFDIRNELIHQLIDLKKQENWNIRIALQYYMEYKIPHPNNIFTRRLMRYFKIIDFPSDSVRKNCISPYYGLDLYQELSKSKIVFNAAVDFSGVYKANMRNIESLGCGAHMISDDGIYPDGFAKGRDFSVYKSFDDFVEKARYFLNQREESEKIAKQGHNTVSTVFSKDAQWQSFQEIVSSL